MIERLINLIERFVDAHELMALAAEKISNLDDHKEDVDPIFPVAKAVTDKLPPTPTPAAVNREAVIQEMKALNIPYKPTARTESLVKQLEAAKKVLEAGPAEIQASFDTPAADPIPTQTASVAASFDTPAQPTVDQVKMALVNLAKVKGRDIALSTLSKWGKLPAVDPKVASADPSLYATIIQKCEEARVAK